jgi:hypothetical protein
MSGSASRHALLLSGALVFLSFNTEVAAQPGYVPVLQNGPNTWQHPFGGVFPPVEGSALPVQQDPSRILIGGQTWHIADLTNPNLKPWARDHMKKDIQEIDKGKIQFTASASCVPPGTPAFMISGGPFLIVQARDKVVIIDEGSPVLRHVYLNVPHTPNPKPSWRGESIGWYEGDTLVVDTIGQNTKTVVDRFGTPHTDKLHVVERWRVIDQGLTLRVDIEVEDPDTFYQPWKTYQVFRRSNGPLVEEICAENNLQFDYHMPVAEKPDF